MGELGFDERGPYMLHGVHAWVRPPPPAMHAATRPSAMPAGPPPAYPATLPATPGPDDLPGHAGILQREVRGMKRCFNELNEKMDRLEEKVDKLMRIVSPTPRIIVHHTPAAEPASSGRLMRAEPTTLSDAKQSE